MQTLYVPHPLSQADKARIRSENAPCRIVDARFAPKGAPIYGLPEKEEAQAVKVDVPSKSDIATMKKADVIEWLEAHGVPAHDGSITDLRAMLRSVMFLD
jgi:hypothetical protein